MSSKSKIIDLEMGEDGTYSEKSVLPSKPIKKYPKKVIGNSTIAKNFKKKKDTVPANVDEFFNGLDCGLSFVEELSSRVNRIMNLRD